MKKYKALQLIGALRSGNYVQGKHYLVTKDDRFCCLGVACNISTHPLDSVEDAGRWSIGNHTVDLPYLIQEEFGFYSTEGKRRDGQHIVIAGERYPSLAIANDKGRTFKQIANYIEANYKYL